MLDKKRRSKNGPEKTGVGRQVGWQAPEETLRRTGHSGKPAEMAGCGCGEPTLEQVRLDRSFLIPLLAQACSWGTTSLMLGLRLSWCRIFPWTYSGSPDLLGVAAGNSGESCGSHGGAVAFMILSCFAPIWWISLCMLCCFHGFETHTFSHAEYPVRLTDMIQNLAIHFKELQISSETNCCCINLFYFNKQQTNAIVLLLTNMCDPLWWINTIQT